MRVLLKTVANTNALVNTTNKKLCYSCAYAEAKCKNPKGAEKHQKRRYPWHRRIKMKTPITKIHNPLRVGTGGCLEKSLLKERKCKHVSRVNT